MFLRESRQRRASGAVVTYLQLVESVWNAERGRSETRVVYNCGRADDATVRERLRTLARGILRRVAPEEMVENHPDWRLVNAWPYGDLYALEHLWRRIGFDTWLPELVGASPHRRLPFERACFAMVANRALAPASKLYCFEQWLQEDVRLAGAEVLELQHLYRAMDLFEAHREAIEERLFFRIADLFACDVDVIFYDTTTLHCEIDQEDAGGAEEAVVRGSREAGGKAYPALRQRGKAKNKRDDLPQVVVGLAMTRDGLPVRSWVFRGDTVDVETVAQVKRDLRGWNLTRCVFVGDAGMVSAQNLKALAAGGGKYIVCMPLRKGTEVVEDVLRRPGRFREVTPTLHVKEVFAAVDGERRRRYVVCFNPEEAKRQRAHRTTLLAELEEMLGRLRQGTGAEHSKAVCALRASERYGKYLRQARGRLVLDRERIQWAERIDGKFVVHTNDDTLTPEDVALGYKQLMQVERAWRLLKSGMRIRPIFHWMPHRIAAHVSLTMIALLLERVAENACGASWRAIQDDLRQVKLAQLMTPSGEVWQVSEPRPEAANRLKQLQIPPPPPLWRVAGPPAHTPSAG